SLTIPHPVSLVNEHVIHVYRDPYIGCGIGNPVVNALLNQEVISPEFTILDVVYTRGCDCRKIEFHIVVLEIVAPGGDFTTEYFYSTSVFANLIYGCFCLRFVFLVEFNDRYFGLRRKVAHLREAYVWLSYPAFNCIWLHSP